MVQLQSDRKRSLRTLQRKRKLQKKWNERKRQRNVTNIESLEDEDQEDSHSKTKVPRTKSPRRIPIRKKKTEKAMSVSKQRKINKNLVEETTPMNKPKVKLKQTKLNFQTHEATNSNVNEISLFESKLRNKPENKQLRTVKLITSTPLRCSVNIRRIPLSPSLEINNITFIETTKKTANKLDDSKNSDQLGDKTQERNKRLLRSNTKIGTPSGIGHKSSKVSKQNKRLTRSTTKS